METFEVRDRRGGFLWIPNSFFDAHIGKLQPSSWLVYCALARKANNETQQCFPSYEEIAKMTGLSRRAVAYGLQELKTAGAIEWTTNGRHNVYYLLDQTSANIALVQKTTPTSAKNDTNQCNGVHPNKTHNKTQEQDSLLLPLDESKIKPDIIEKAFQHFISLTEKTKHYTLTPKRRKMAEVRWKEAVQMVAADCPPDQVEKRAKKLFSHAMDALIADDWMRDKGFWEWEQIFRSAENFQKWIDRYENPPEPRKANYASA